MVERMENPTFRDAVQTILSEVSVRGADEHRGEPLSVLPSVYPACLQAGETSGDLPGMLVRFTEAMRVAVKARSSLTAALVYPAFLLAALLGTAAYLLLGVVPNFVPFFAGFNQELPPLTTALLAAAEFVRSQLVWVTSGLLGALLLFAAWSRTERAKRLRDRFVLRLPAVGQVLRLYAVSQFSRALGTLLAGGCRSPTRSRWRARGRQPPPQGVLEPTADRGARAAPSWRRSPRAVRSPDSRSRWSRVGEGTGDLARMVPRSPISTTR